ncbi:MAG: response regulator [Planctomycetota bacterium]
MLEDIGPELRVLVVDDNPQNRELLSAFLEVAGCEVEEAAGGQAAIDRLIAGSEPVDVVVLDIMMPRVSGFQVLAALKHDPKARDIPVIIVTALNETSDVERSMDAGAADFLSKPVIQDELVARVCAQAAIRRAERDLAEVETLTRA